MNIKVYKNREAHQIDNDVYGTQNENNVTELKIEVPEQYENWNKRIVFLTDEGNFWDYIKDNTYTIKNSITKYDELEAYIWLTENAESTEESINDFRSRTFRLSFFANENADDLVPDEQQIDGFNTMITALNVEIKEVKQINTDFTKLKQEVEQAEDERNKAETERNAAEKARKKAETERKTAENNRASAENNRDLTETARETAESIRKKNESNRIVNENGRVEAENNRSSAEEARATAEDERKTYINNLKKDIENGELNGATFTPHLDTNGNLSWTNNKNLGNPTEINIMGPQGPQGPQGPTYQVTEEDLQAIADKITADANSKFNNNVTKQTNTFNNNADTKQTEYDNNATAKLEEYNNNSTTKLAEFNENAESYEKRITDLEQERDEIAEQMPWNTTEQATEISVDDAAKYSRNKLELFGNTEQTQYTGVQLLDMLDSVNGYFTNNAGNANTSAYGFHTQEYIDVGNNTSIYGRFEALDNIKIGRFFIQEYNENKESIQRHTIGIYDSVFTLGQVRKWKVNLSEGTKYIRLSNYTLQKLDGESYVDQFPTKDYWNDLVKATISFTDVDIYEPYTGGQPSPSPDYPQPIHVATGVQTIKLNDNIIATLDLGTTELCKIVDENGNVVAQDSLEAQNGKWYIHPKVVKINAKNYVWNIITVTEGNLFRAYLTKLNTIKKVSHIVVCNYFKGIIGSAGRADGNIYYNTGSNSIDIICNDFSTIEEFNNFITENDLIIYALANDETLKEITDTSLTTVLDKLYNNFKLNKGTNNIIVETDNGVGVNMELTYMQDLQTKLNLLEAMCVSSASQEV